MSNFNEYLIFIACYLSGSVPWGLIITKLLLKEDIRTKGSGNIGATNVTRIGGKKLGVVVFLLDFLKGFLPVLVYKNLFPENFLSLAIAGFLAVLGHIFPIWLKFKGGKGVATGFGVLFAMVPIIAAIMTVLWFLAYKISKISAVGALVSYGLMPFIFAFSGSDKNLTAFSVLLSLLIYIRHRENIMRLINGEEKPIKKTTEGK